MKKTAILCQCGNVIEQIKCERCGKSRFGNVEPRLSAYRSGYDRRWQTWRKRYIERRIENGTYYCDDCELLFTPQLGAIPELHHIEKLSDNRSRQFDETNILMLHRRCHSKRTARGE